MQKIGNLQREPIKVGKGIFILKLIIVIIIILVIQALVALVDQPEPEHPLRADLAEEYIKDKKKFMKNAEEYTKKHSEKRPAD